MDVGNAVLVVAGVMGIVSLVTRLFPRLLDFRDGSVVILVAVVIAIGVLFLARETVWASEQVLGGKPLDALDAWSVVFAGLLLGLGSTALDRTLKSVSNIGENAARYKETPPG